MIGVLEQRQQRYKQIAGQATIDWFNNLNDIYAAIILRNETWRKINDGRVRRFVACKDLLGDWTLHVMMENVSTHRVTKQMTVKASGKDLAQAFNVMLEAWSRDGFKRCKNS